MSKRIEIVKLAFSLGFVTVLALGTIAAIGEPVAMAGPTPDCGPDFTWDCTMPNGTHQYVDGTRCDIAAFQRQTGARCVIARGF